MTTENLIKDILDYNVCEYEEKYSNFIKKYNHVDDGKSSGKVVDLIEKLAADSIIEPEESTILHFIEEVHKEGGEDEE